MKRPERQQLYLAGIFVVALVVIVYFMPRSSRMRYSYEVNRPWSYSLLTAPFDVTVYRDSATVKAMTDSVDRALVPVYRASQEPLTRLRGAIEASRDLTRGTKGALESLVGELYAQGVVDSRTAQRIAEGELPYIKLQEGTESKEMGTGGLRSQRDAYAMMDSMFRHSEERGTIQGLNIASLLVPNLTEDAEATAQYREAMLQPIVAGIGVIQKGERIIDRGDIVTPQLYQILKTYEETLDRSTGNSRARLVNSLVGRVLFTGLLLSLLVSFFALFYPQNLRRLKWMTAVAILVTGFFIFAVVMQRAFEAGLYVVPLAILPIMLTVFFDARTAFFGYVIEVFLCSTVASFPLEFCFIEIMAGAAVIFSLKELSRRSELLRSAVVAFVMYTVAYVAVELMTAGTLEALSWRLVGYFAINAVLISFAYILIFVFEKAFGMISVVTLVELSDINNPLLRKLSTECPGTFQHSMAVSNLASEAGHAIGANVQLIRTGALYHDIGKIDNPAFFTENQHGVNPHDALTPQQSAKIITGHITDGERRAREAKLPQVVYDLIAQHHGKGKAKYFYTMEQRAHQGEEVDAGPFTYPGPNPQTREASLLMMADTVEAASHSLQDHSPEAIRAMVDRLVDAQVAEGLHNESPLSFRDIRTIKKIFTERLRSMYHTRIAYPPASGAAEAKG